MCWRKKLLFRGLAVLLGLGLLVVVECALALCGIGAAVEMDDPFVGFQGAQPLFTPNGAGDRYEIPPSRYEFFRPESFAAKKGEREFRIFCLGGSTVQGRPYAIETSFTTWLELSLNAADPSREWEAVNCGGVSYASYRLAPLMQEMLKHSPDLFIIYTGHNEFLEDRTYGHVKQTSPALAWAYSLAAKSRTFGLLRSAVRELRPPTTSGAGAPTQLPAEVDALLDYRGGLAEYQRDDAWRKDVIEHFEFNLRRMIAMARQAGVPVLLVDPVYNLRDSPPFKSEQRADLAPAQIKEFEALIEQAVAVRETDLAVAAKLVEQAVAIDERHAGARYFLARCYEGLGDVEAAHVEFLRAKEEDICPLRILEPMVQAIQQVGSAEDVSVVGARGAFIERSPDGIMGDEWLLDHVHPTIEGHQLIARLILEEMERQELVSLSGDWDERRKEAFRAHLGSLDQAYYSRGDERLEGLRRWTQGRAYKVRPSEGRRLIDGG